MLYLQQERMAAIILLSCLIYSVQGANNIKESVCRQGL